MKPNVTTIPATLTPQRQSLFDTAQRRRTAAYARVSTDSDEQETSFEAQVEYYTKYISERSELELIKVYTDEGISALNTKSRSGFNQMIADALDGKLDLIITKSVSRFARNTVDSLTAVRNLKAAGVEVYFEKENIWTFDGKGELLITIMSSLAQEESRSISENVTWGKRRSFEQGNVYLPYARFMGYERGEDGRPRIVEAEAKIIRDIFSQYLHGMTPNAIARELTKRGIHSPGGKEKWSVSTVRSVLQNEKYKGEAILQKSITTDYLQKTRKKNEGEAPQYYVKESHKPIIQPEVFDLVQDELRKHRNGGKTRTCSHAFSSRIICGECGGHFGHKTWRTTLGGERTSRVIWQCNEKYRVKGKVNCQTPHLTDEQIEHAFVTAFNQLLGNKARYIADYEPIIKMLTDTGALESEAADLQEKQKELYTLVKNCIDEKARRGFDPGLEERHGKLTKRYDAVKSRLDEIFSEIDAQTVKRTKIQAFLEDISAQGDILAAFDETLWRRTVERVIVYKESDVRVEFKDGRQLKVNILGT